MPASWTLALGSALVGSVLATSASCPLTANTLLSCHNTTAVQNTCCFNTPGGLLLQTQFWDTNPPSGPADSWTIHGLWPDNCDGTYQQFCDPSREYTNISAIIKEYDPSLLQYMETYWTSNNGSAESFWEHEWGKHGTCISSLDTSCYVNYKPQEEVYDFANRTVSLFKTLDSYKLLAAAGIAPSSSKTYASADILAALAKGHSGIAPAIQCSDGALDEVWWYYNTKGSVQTGDFVPASPAGVTASCPSTGVKYLPKGTAATTSTSTAKITKTRTITKSHSPTPKAHKRMS